MDWHPRFAQIFFDSFLCLSLCIPGFGLEGFGDFSFGGFDGFCLGGFGFEGLNGCSLGGLGF